MTFDKVPAWAAWLAQDADGAWWAYEAEPNKQDKGWYEKRSGASCGWAKARRRPTGRRH